MSTKQKIKTDFHTHLLPDLDCSGNPAVACELIKNMKELGIENIVLTPHFYPQLNNSVRDFIQRRDSKIKNLITAMKENNIDDISLFPAAEVLLCPGLNHLEDLELLCIEGTKTILIEMTDLPWPEALLDTLDEIRDLGLDIVIAHADRYGKKESEKLIDKGFKVQLNADSLCGFTGKKQFINWVKDGYVYALGSDKHVRKDKHTTEYKDFAKASSAISEYAERIDNRMMKLIGKK